ncbi:phage antirepressor N-terminal domain-containing protein [Pseudomonas monteilii]|uniref:phage antirepressor N-terminal domain-containing protein n=1 Tax=Pseudomonas monteilii TaxID=76759 RepID=UPI001E47FA01|nr:phage antirepressor N-terminal domain-containing protein [Pseudomonas monteilii]MCE0934771.1 phage antirepressor N-terminal domain-containing protein [Pseudomonas monteilii]WJR40614.1 phage antirepressor N-terminal domain-containing protein [Pseudomonas monteilii]
MSALMTVPFHGIDLYLVEHEGQPFVPMRPMVEGIGLDWKSQHAKLSSNQRRWGMVNITTPSAGGMQESSCIPLRKLPGWLSRLEPNKVKKLEVRQRIEEFQDECDDALWQYWNDGHAINPRVQQPAANDESIPLERRLPVAADNFDAAKRIAESLGLEGNQAILSANSMVRAAIGVDLMEMAGVKRLVNEAQEMNYLPSELGAKFGMTANGMNKLLAQCGLQHHVTYKLGKKRWEVTPDGKEYAVITDTGKKHSDGKPVQQILWKESVAKPLKRLAEKLQAEMPEVVAHGLSR